MKVLRQDASGTTIVLSDEELTIINNALNEICNGIDVPEFATRIGADRKEAEQLLEQIGSVLRPA
jgi:hypothetical protein